MADLSEEDAFVIQTSDLRFKKIEEVLEILKCDRNGLTKAAAEQRLLLLGYNSLEQRKIYVILYLWVLTDESKFLRFLGFMWNPLSWVLEAAAIMAFVTAIGGGKPSDWIIFVGIVILLLMNSGIGLIEEIDTENAAAVPFKTKVRRAGGLEDEDAVKLVPGDVISIQFGDIIPADVRLLEGDPVVIDQYALAGECLPETNCPGNPVFSGSTCKQGNIEAVVIATGRHTCYGEHRYLLDATNKVCQYQKVLTAIMYFCICSTAVGIIIEITALYPSPRRPYHTLIDNLLVLLIGGIPIAMHRVLSMAMTIGSRRLSEKGAITHRMGAIENLAGMDVLCSDKTGILTVNELASEESIMQDSFLAGAVSVHHLILAASRAYRLGNPDDVDKSINELLNEEEKHARSLLREAHFQPFNPTDERTALTYIDGRTNTMRRVSKGAPEKILDLLDDKSNIEQSVHLKINEYAEKGLQALAVAYQEVPDGISGGPWVFLGLLPIRDRPLEDSVSSIENARNLGVNVKMITGDPLNIAKHTADSLGWRTDIHPSSSLLGRNEDDIITAVDMIQKAEVFAGVSPEYKYEIVKRLRAKKRICGVTGKGVNDVPALYKADVGIAVPDATDAARSASDIVLKEPGLSVIIRAVKTSRKVFHRMRSYTIYVVSMTTFNLLGFMVLALVWKFSFPPFMLLLIAITNHVLVTRMSRDNVKPSPRPDKWRLSELFVVGVVLGCYLASMTVLFFWTASRTNFFETCFKVSSLKGTGQDNLGKLSSAIYLQISIISQALAFVTRSHGWSFIKPPGSLTVTFCACQLMATLFAVFANWSFATVQGMGWGWAIVVWVYSIVTFILLGIVRIVTCCILTALENRIKMVHSMKMYLRSVPLEKHLNLENRGIVNSRGDLPLYRRDRPHLE
ncbi:hypothetical protein C5167_011975 [Papaver somniferum]|uniref:Plasma membrane ATPase n=1 Tax=Papaver somniferum TaxID=3469 RepID=A0A4Y7J036_PAPSO|nr:plasma membrane ATPase 1-like [Papaver somniferum]RZC53119.1 hypothetical protein C5167_011975 [Papaver somniferum]